MGEQTRLSLSKPERLRNLKLIDRVFKTGSTIKAFPLIFTYIQESDPQDQLPLQVLFAAPKRQFRKAVDRNRVKRILRDRFRRIKPELSAALNGRQLRFAIIYTSRDLPDYRAVDRSLQKIISRLHVSAGA